MTYENEVHTTSQLKITMSGHAKKKCKYSYLNFKSHYEVWVNFTLGHAYSP